MVQAIGDRQRILFELRSGRGDPGGALGDAAELNDAFGDHVHIGLDGLIHLVEQFMQADETRAFDVPMRLLHLRLQIHGGRQPLVHERVEFGSALLRDVVFGFIHCRGFSKAVIGCVHRRILSGWVDCEKCFTSDC